MQLVMQLFEQHRGACLYTFVQSMKIPLYLFYNEILYVSKFVSTLPTFRNRTVISNMQPTANNQLDNQENY